MLVTPLTFFSLPVSYAQKVPSAGQEISGSVLAFQLEKRQALINVGQDQGIHTGHSVALLSDGQEIGKGHVRNVFTDSAKVTFETENVELRDGASIKVIVPPETDLGRMERIFHEKFSGSIETGFTFNNTDGKRNAFRTFRQDGLHYFEDFDINYKDQIEDQYDVEGNLQFGVSDDSYRQPERFAGRRGHLAITQKDNRYGVTLGDEYTYFSHYTMSQSLKGVKGFYNRPSSYGTTEVTAVFGTNKHRWEDFYKNLENEPFTRYVSGVRIGHKYKNLASGGFNFVDSSDEGGVGSDGQAAIHNDVLSLDGELHLWSRLNAKGEMAYAFMMPDIKNSEDVKGDKAWRIDTNALLTDWEFFKNRSYYGFEWAGQNFTSLSGILKTDRQEHYFNHKVDVGRFLTLMYRFNRYWNNLKDGLPTSTKTFKNDVELVLRPLSWHPQTEVRTELFVTKREASDVARVNNSTESMYWQLRSQISKILGWVGFRISDKADHITPTNARRSRGVEVGAQTKWQWWELLISPRILAEAERDIEPTTSDKSKMIRLRTGFTVDGRDLQVSFHHGLRNENNQINADNAERYTFDVDVRYFVFGNRSRLLTFTFRRDNFINANDNEWDENAFVWKYIQYF